MQFLKKLSMISLTTLLLVGTSSVSGFSFNFDDDDDASQYYNWYGTNRPLIAPNGTYFYPSLPYFERTKLVDRRQQRMEYKGSAVNKLSEMLYGSSDFDRATAIKLARGIESIAGPALVDFFHPGAVVDRRSRTTFSLWGNQEGFKAYAAALQNTAKELAEELQKQPTKEEGGIFLPKPVEPYEPPSEETIPVSAEIWPKFNAMMQVCYACHRGFRGAEH